MRWDRVVEAVAITVEADDALGALFGAAMRYRGTGVRRSRVLEWFLVGDTERELDEPCTIQFDIWTDNGADTRAAERRLRALFHQDIPATFAGILMWANYLEGDTLSAPDRDNAYGRAVRFRFGPLRERYDDTEPMIES